MVETRFISFTKMHGAGNDFVVLDLRSMPEPSRALCRAMSNRHTGVGCDQILGIEAPRSEGAVASYRIWTADGSASLQCGNGARCVAAWLERAGMAPGPQMLLESPARTHLAQILSQGVVRVGMGLPCFDHSAVPLVGFPDKDLVCQTYLDGPLKHRFSAVSLGNPHAVIEVEDVDKAAVESIGSQLQRSQHLPASVNVGFVEVLSRNRVRLRVYEYGSGETLACGSGACGAVAVLIRAGRVDRHVTVEMRGGELSISWPNTGGEISMTGPAAFVFEGQYLDIGNS